MLKMCSNPECILSILFTVGQIKAKSSGKFLSKLIVFFLQKSKFPTKIHSLLIIVLFISIGETATSEVFEETGVKAGNFCKLDLFFISFVFVQPQYSYEYPFLDSSVLTVYSFILTIFLFTHDCAIF